MLTLKRREQAKQRLAGALPPGARRQLVAAMAADVMSALGDAAAVAATVVVTGDPWARELAQAHDAIVVDDPEDAGHATAALRGVARARELGAERVLLVPGDVPALDAAELDELLARDWAPPAVTLVADRGGTGTNALLLEPLDAIPPAFGVGSLARHRTLAAGAGVRFEIVRAPTLALDVDTADDLDALRALLAANPRGASATRAALQRLASHETAA